MFKFLNGTFDQSLQMQEPSVFSCFECKRMEKLFGFLSLILGYVFDFVWTIDFQAFTNK